MFQGDDPVGVFILYKLKVEPFTEKIELVTSFRGPGGYCH